MMTGAVSLVNVKADSPAGIARDSAFTEEEWEEASDMSEGEDK